MIHFRPGSHAYDIVSVIGITGEFPYRSVRLFGNARTYKVLIGRLCEVQTFRDYNSGDEMTCRLLTVTGKSFGKTVRLYKTAIPILNAITELPKLQSCASEPGSSQDLMSYLNCRMRL